MSQSQNKAASLPETRKPPQGSSSTAPVQAAAPTAIDDPAVKLAEENARLKAELAELKARASQADVMPAHPAEMAAHVGATGKLPVYEVELPGFRARLAVCPHCKAEQTPAPSKETQCEHCEHVQPFKHAGRQPCANKDCPKKSFDAAQMVQCNECDKLFKVGHAPPRMVDKMRVPALSPGDAWERFRTYNGITATTQQPKIVAVTA